MLSFNSSLHVVYQYLFELFHVIMFFLNKNYNHG